MERNYKQKLKQALNNEKYTKMIEKSEFFINMSNEERLIYKKIFKKKRRVFVKLKAMKSSEKTITKIEMRLNNDKEVICHLKSKERGQKSFRNSSFMTNTNISFRRRFCRENKEKKYETLRK